VSLNFCVWFDHVCIPLVLPSATILARDEQGQRELEDQVVEQSWDGREDLQLCVLLILKAEILQQGNIL